MEVLRLEEDATAAAARAIARFQVLSGMKTSTIEDEEESDPSSLDATDAEVYLSPPLPPSLYMYYI
jgi:hypothetical protein